MKIALQSVKSQGIILLSWVPPCSWFDWAFNVFVYLPEVKLVTETLKIQSKWQTQKRSTLMKMRMILTRVRCVLHFLITFSGINSTVCQQFALQSTIMDDKKTSQWKLYRGQCLLSLLLGICWHRYYLGVVCSKIVEHCGSLSVRGWGKFHSRGKRESRPRGGRTMTTRHLAVVTGMD